MEILNKKLEEKFKLFDKIDKMHSNSQTKINSLDISDSKRLSKIKKNKNKSLDLSSNKKSNKAKMSDLNNNYEDIYSNFELNKNYSIFYFKNYVDVMSYMYAENKKGHYNPNKNKINNNKEYIIKDEQKNKNYQIPKFKSDLLSEYGTNLLPKEDYVINRLLRYGENIEKKKQMLREENEENFKKMAKPEISEYSKNIYRDPEKFVKRLFYNKKDKKEKIKNNNFTFKPILNKKTIEIANRLEPSSKRLLKKKKSVSQEEIEKLAINNYKNLCNNYNKNNNNISKNKKIGSNIKKIINKLYNQGLEDLKKKDMKYKENMSKKNEEYKRYPFQPNASNNIHKSKSIKYLNDTMYQKQIEWKAKKNMENFKKKEMNEDLYLNAHCSFKPDISHEIIKDDENIIKRNLKSINSYVEKRRKQIKEKEDKNNKSFSSNKYGFSLKDIISEPIKELNTERLSKKNCHCVNLKKSIKNYRNNNKNNLDCVIPPYTERIFYYYNQSGEENNPKKFNNLTNQDYTQIEFVNAINTLHKEIGNLNI